MNPELERFKYEWENGDRELARKIAQAFIEAHRDALAPLLANLTLAELVAGIEGARASGREYDRIIADMWLLTQPVRNPSAPLKLTSAPSLRCEEHNCVPWTEEFADAWKHGHRIMAVIIAKNYVEAHRPALTEKLASSTREQIVQIVEYHRERGDAENAAVADMWLLSEYEPQHIKGALQAGVRRYLKP